MIRVWKSFWGGIKAHVSRRRTVRDGLYLSGDTLVRITVATQPGLGAAIRELEGIPMGEEVRDELVLTLGGLPRNLSEGFLASPDPIAEHSWKDDPRRPVRTGHRAVDFG